MQISTFASDSGITTTDSTKTTENLLRKVESVHRSVGPPPAAAKTEESDILVLARNGRHIEIWVGFQFLVWRKVCGKEGCPRHWSTTTCSNMTRLALTNRARLGAYNDIEVSRIRVVVMKL